MGFYLPIYHSAIKAFKVVLILQLHTVYAKFLPIFGIPEILWTTLSKFYRVLTKNGRHIGLQSGHHLAGEYGIHQMFAKFLESLRSNGSPCPNLIEF